MKRMAWIFCWIGVFGAIICIGYTACLFFTTPRVIHETQYDEYRKIALEMIRAESGNFFNLSTAILAGLWAGLVLRDEGRIDVKDRPNVLLFGVSNLVLVGSLVFNLLYSRLLSRLFWDMGPLLSQREKFADVLSSPWIVIHYKLSLVYFFGGLILGALSLASATYFRREQ